MFTLGPRPLRSGDVAVFRPFSAAYLADPYPFLARLREKDPVFKSQDFGAWVVTRHADCLRILTDDDRFSSDPVTSRTGMGAVVSHMRAEAPLGNVAILGSCDPPDHTRIRAEVNAAFTPRQIREFEPEIEGMARDLVQRLPAGRPFDVVSQLAEPYAVISILAYIGVQPEHLDGVRSLAHPIMTARSTENPSPELLAAAAGAHAQFADYLQHAPGHRGVIAVLMEAVAKERITLDEVIMLIIHITTAGNGPAAFAVGNLLMALAAHPDQYAMVRADPSLATQAVEEMLRWDSPVQLINRFVRVPHEFEGKKFRAGESVFAVVGSANRDAAVFEDPDRFDITRSPGRLLSFGQGIHFCLGAPLARLELAILLRTFAARFATIEVLPPGPQRAPDLLIRGARQLTVRAG